MGSITHSKPKKQRDCVFDNHSFDFITQAKIMVFKIIISKMFELKLQYLNEENLSLKRQIRDLKNILSIQSPQNHKSVLFQLQQSNQALSKQIQQIKDELLLQRSAREIQRTDHSEVVQQLNRCIFVLKEQKALLEEILKREHKTELQSSVIHRLFRNDKEKEKNQLLHHYAHPMILFQVLEGLLELVEPSEDLEYFEDETVETGNRLLNQKSDQLDISINKLLNTKNQSLNYDGNSQNNLSAYRESRSSFKWFEQISSLYFLRKNRRGDLHLCLQKAKNMQQQLMSMQEKEEKKKISLTTNVDLLRKSYVQLIGEYQNLKKKYRTLQLYVQELQHRNQLLINSRICRLS